LAPWADHLYACDGKWWNRHGAKVVKSFVGERWTTIPPDDPGPPFHAAMATKYECHALYRELSDYDGLAKEPGRITYGGNGGHQAIHLAYNMGATRIILLGFDYCDALGNIDLRKADDTCKIHWFGDHPKDLNTGCDFMRWLRGIKVLARDLHAAGVEVINCSRRTAIPDFERRPINDIEADPDRADRGTRFVAGAEISLGGRA